MELRISSWLLTTWHRIGTRTGDKTMKCWRLNYQDRELRWCGNFHFLLNLLEILKVIFWLIKILLEQQVGMITGSTKIIFLFNIGTEHIHKLKFGKYITPENRHLKFHQKYIIYLWKSIAFMKICTFWHNLQKFQ